MSFLSSEDRDNIRNMLSDPATEEDITMLLWAAVAYAAARLGTEILLPYTHRGYTYQQYLVTLVHQALVLPYCVVAGMLGTLDGATNAVYILTGAYIFSDSIINYSPVAGCVSGVDGAPSFSWGVHAHHFLTILLCLLGTTLPKSLEFEGACCILLGEAGSLWITVTLLRPSAANFFLRYYSFLVTRLVSFAIAIDMARQLSFPANLILLLCALGLALDNRKTLQAMGSAAQRLSGAGFANQRGLSR